MMENLSMTLLDIASNSMRANASFIEIFFTDSLKDDCICIEIKDNGKGMDEKRVKDVLNPFFTTRSSRRIGLGIPFFKALADQCEGDFYLDSKVNVGTCIRCTMKKSHWDVPPRGDIGDAVVLTCCMNEDVHVRFCYRSDSKEFVFDSLEIKEILGGVSMAEAEIMSWCKAYINESIEEEEIR